VLSEPHPWHPTSRSTEWSPRSLRETVVSLFSSILRWHLMLVPKEFDELCRYIHQDSFLIHETLKDALAEAVSGLSSEQCDVIHGFVDELLAGPYDESDLTGC